MTDDAANEEVVGEPVQPKEATPGDAPGENGAPGDYADSSAAEARNEPVGNTESDVAKELETGEPASDSE